MSSMPSTGTLQAKRHRELRGAYRNESEESATSGQQRFMSPNRLASKYTDPERTSSSSFKPPMLRDSMKKPQATELHETQQSSFSSALSYLKNVFTGRGPQTPTSTSNVIYNEPIIKIVEKNNLDPFKKTKLETEQFEQKDSKGEKDKKEAQHNIEEGDVGSLPLEVGTLNETKTPNPETKSEAKVAKVAPKNSRFPFSYDPKKLRANAKEELDVIADNIQEYIPPTLLPSMSSDYPLDRKLEARMQKIEQFKKRQLVLPPTILEPHTSISNSVVTRAERPQHSDNTLKPEYIFPPRELRPQATDFNRSISPEARASRGYTLHTFDKWYQEKSRNQKAYVEINQKRPLSSPKQRGRRHAGSPISDSKTFAQRSDSGGTTAYRIRSSPVVNNNFYNEGVTRPPVVETDRKKISRSSPARPENRWQKNSFGPRELGTNQKSRTRSKSTSDKTITSFRSMHSARVSRYHKRAKSTTGSEKLTSSNSFIDDRDIPLGYPQISPESNQRYKRASRLKSTMSAGKITSKTHKDQGTYRQSNSYDAKRQASARRFNSSNSQHSSPPRVSVASTPSPKGSKADVSIAMSPAAQLSAKESASITQPNENISQQSTSPSQWSPPKQSPTFVRKSRETTGRSPSPSQPSPTSTWRPNQQSPSSHQRSPQVAGRNSASPWQKQMPNQQYIRKRSGSKKTPPIRQASGKSAAWGPHAASRRANSNRPSPSYSIGAVSDSHASRSHGDFYAIQKRAQGFGIRNQPDIDGNPRPKWSRISHSPKNQFSNWQQAHHSSSSWSPHSRGNQNKGESKWSVKNNIFSKNQSQLLGAQRKKSPNISNQPAWKKKSQFLQGRQSSPSSSNHHINRHVVQSMSASENRNSPKPQWVYESNLTSPVVKSPLQSSESPRRKTPQLMPSFEDLEPTTRHTREGGVSPPQTPSVPTEMGSPVPGRVSRASLNASPSFKVLTTPPASPGASPEKGPLDNFEAITMSVSPLSLEALNFNGHCDVQPELKPTVADQGNNDILSAARVPSRVMVNSSPEDIYQGPYFKTSILYKDSIGEEMPEVKDCSCPSSIRFAFVDGNLSNSASSNLNRYLADISVEESDFYFNSPVVDHLVDCSNSALFNSLTPENNDKGLIYNQMLQDSVQFTDAGNDLSAIINKKLDVTSNSAAQSKSLQKVKGNVQKKLHKPQVLPSDKSSASAPAGAIGDICESQLSPLGATPLKNDPIPASSKVNENKIPIKPPELQLDTGKLQLNMKQTRNVKSEAKQKAKEENCTTCVPIQSKLWNESERRSTSKQMPPGFRNMKEASPQTNTYTREKRISKGRRKNLQGLVKTRSPPTDSSPLKYRIEGADYSPSQAPLTWGRNAAVAAFPSSGERRYSSYHKQSSRQFESAMPEQREAADNKDTSGMMMKKTLSFFSSFFKRKEDPSAGLEVQKTQEKVEDAASAKPDYVRNGAILSTFHESLNKNRSSSHLMVPKPEAVDKIESTNSKLLNSPAKRTKQIALSESINKEHSPEVPETEKSPPPHKRMKDPDDYATNQTKMGELP